MNDKGPVTVHMFMKIPETTVDISGYTDEQLYEKYGRWLDGQRWMPMRILEAMGRRKTAALKPGDPGTPENPIMHGDAPYVYARNGHLVPLEQKDRSWAERIVRTLRAEKLYAITYLDPATPSFVTAQKTAYGTAETIARIMAEASGEAFEQGEAVHVAMLRTGAISDFREKHMNVWDCPYTLTANRVEYVDAELEDGDRCFHAVRARFSNLTVAGTHPITLRQERVWGPKALFEGDDTIMCNRLFQPWEEGRSMFTGIFDDIFADG